MVAPLLEALLLRLVRRGSEATSRPAPTRLVGRPHTVDSVAYVADRTTALRQRPGGGAEALPAGSLVLPALLGRGAPSYVVVTHDPVDVWLRIGPFETLDDRVVQHVELRVTVSIGDSASLLRELAEDAGDLAAVEDALLHRLAREVSARTTEAVRRRTLADLTELSLGVLLDGSLPTTFLGGLVSRSDLEVVDVDWPTEGRGWSSALTPGPRGSSSRPGVPG